MSVSAVFSQGSGMTTCLGNSCSFSLICVSYVIVYQFIYVLLSLLVWKVECGLFPKAVLLLRFHLFYVRCCSNFKYGKRFNLNTSLCPIYLIQ